MRSQRSRRTTGRATRASSDLATITAADLPPTLVSPERIAAGTGVARPTLEDLERQYITFVLRETRGNQTRAAKVLGISRKALWEKRKRFRIDD